LTKKLKIISLIFLSPNFLIGCDGSEEIIKQTNEAIEIATGFVGHLAEGEFTVATQMFDDKVREELSAEALAETWQLVTEHFGPYIEHEFKEIESLAQYQVIVIDATFVESHVTFEISFDQDNQIAGFSIH